MYLLAKFGDHRSHRNGDINSYIKSYMDNLETAKLTASIRHIGTFLKPGILIYNSDISDTADGKTTRRRTQTTAKRFAFHTNAKSFYEINHTICFNILNYYWKTLLVFIIRQCVDSRIRYLHNAIFNNFPEWFFQKRQPKFRS